jgi:hypothetical protein
MNIDEYKNRINRAHTVTGVPSYWEELQKMTEERDSLLRQVDELQAEVSRLSQIAKY